MVKVCHMTSAHEKEDDRIFHKECVSLAKAGYDVYLVERGDSFERNGVHIVGVGDIPASRSKRMTEGAKKVYEAAKKLDADIYHFHDPELLPYGLKLKKAGKKVIFDSHERYTEQIAAKPYLPHWCAKVIASIYHVYEKSVLQQMDAVIFPCTMNGINPFAGECQRAAIISNAAILGEFFERYDPKRDKKPNLTCHVGSLTFDRGITQNILGTARAGAVLALAGPFKPGTYQNELDRLPESACVEYRGILDRDGVCQLLAESNVGLCTLLDRGQYLKCDNFSIKVYEYMSMGLPVILSHSPYNDRMVEQYHFGICVDPENADEIAAAIRYLLDNPEEAKHMGENGRKAIEKEFNWGVEAQKLLALYEDILKD